MRLTKRTKLIIAVPVLLVAGFFLYRNFACPPKPIFNETEIPDSAISRMAKDVAASLLDIDSVAKRVVERRVLLVGETHFKNETMEYFIHLLEKLPNEQLIVHLELPEEVQKVIDDYFINGDEKYLQEIKSNSDCLPYSKILSWCYANRKRVKKIIAVDENYSHIFMMRAVCHDTRNKTMAEKIFQSYKNFPDAKIIFYGGQMHTLKSGRYLYDVDNRTPAGKRLIELGIKENDIFTILLEGKDRFPLSRAWGNEKGAIALDNKFLSLPINYFFTEPIFNVKNGSDLFDFYVNLGMLTEISE